MNTLIHDTIFKDNSMNKITELFINNKLNKKEFVHYVSKIQKTIRAILHFNSFLNSNCNYISSAYELDLLDYAYLRGIIEIDICNYTDAIKYFSMCIENNIHVNAASLGIIEAYINFTDKYCETHKINKKDYDSIISKINFEELQLQTSHHYYLLIKYFFDHQKAYDKSFKYIQQALLLFKDDVEILQFAGLHYQYGNYVNQNRDLALCFYLKAHHLNNLDIYSLESIIEIYKHDYKQVINYGSMILQIYKIYDPIIINIIGRAYLKEKKYNMAYKTLMLAQSDDIYYQLACLFDNPEYINYNSNTVLEYLKKIKNKDDSVLCFLAETYRELNDLDISFEYAEKSYNLVKDDDSIIQMANWYAYGIGCDIDYTNALTIIGNSESNDVLDVKAYILYNRKEYKLCIDTVNTILNKDSRHSSNIYIGLCYYYGNGVKQNYDMAFDIFADVGIHNWIGQYYLGKCYYHGHGTAQNFKLAFEIFDKISNNPTYYYNQRSEYKDNQIMIAQCYLLGHGVRQDIMYALKLYKKIMIKYNEVIDVGKLVSNINKIDASEIIKLITSNIPENSCCICYKKFESNRTAYIPCGHANVCNECDKNIKKCPVCRTKIESKQKIYL
jgi:TPR repeat protein